ncbi:phage gp6-like head-tail connector protein [Arsenophonus nasoniae]|uniref:Phage gp6-like head-tail connector protein n=1 Tax=Arsenophonus nasoniae TaxID=638 RepID=A0AA95G921_9GAMM|nr:phage gp6-like head-tail connector protein [Arsenophonus nasoniae]WGL93772.1 phage gp6-like head-tail connector protein [Arsenophonus nasoniae]WGL96016.1 phage gp6-like head-tail connector protein [Arsenophonus nasoniae]
MNERELSLLESIGEVVKEALAKQEADLTEKIKSVKAHVDEQILNLKQEIKNKERVINDQILEEKTKKIIEEQIKQQPEIKLPDFEQLISEKIADIAQSLFPPELPDIDALIANAVSKLPKPKDGRSVSLDNVRGVITEEVKRQVAEIPFPQDGQDADPDVVAKKLLELIPPPKDGKSISLDDVRPVIAAEVKKIFDEYPKPEDGKDADPKVVAKKIMEIMPKPKDGQDGRDALQIEIMPGIDESKSYPRGTFATHRGGIWRAFQKTTGMHGWECVINGHYAESREMKDARTLVIRSEMADGQVNTSEHTIPTMIYCGVYSIEKDYEPGDVVTWGGSLWHCNEQTKDKPGEHNSKGWTLIVKRGRDAK